MCSAPIAAAGPAPEPAAQEPGRGWRERVLLSLAILLGVLIFLAVTYLVLFVWLRLSPGELVWWGLAAWLSARLLSWSWGPRRQPRLRVPTRPKDSAHDAAIAISAVLGVRDGLRRD